MQDMTIGSPLKLILTFSLPLLLGNLFQQAYHLADAAIVGQTLGSMALAAVGSTSSVQFLVTGFCQGLCLGFAIPVGQRFGAKDLPEMHRYEAAGSLLAVFIALLLTTGTAFFCRNILHMLQVPQEIFEASWQYLFVIFLPIPFTIMYNWLAGIMRAVGDSRTPFLYLSAASLLNIVLDCLFIIVFHLGVFGAALATSISQAVSAFLCLRAVVRKFPVLHIASEERRLSFSHGRELLTMGVPMGMQWSVIAIGAMVMQSANNSLGTLYVAAFTAASKIKQFALCPFDAIATSVSTFVAQNYGARQMQRICQGLRKGLAAAVGYGLCAGIMMVLFDEPLNRLFLDESHVGELYFASLYLRRLGYCLWLLGITNVCRGGLQGMGYAGRAMDTGLISMAGRIVVCIGFVGALGYDAVTWADQIAWFAGACASIPVLRQSLKETDIAFAKDKKGELP